MARSAILNIMIEAALKAGRSLHRDFLDNKIISYELKGPADYVTNCDKKAEEIIKTHLLKARPDYSYLLEESGAKKGVDAQHCFIVDPLDGTTNFMHKIPYFCVSIALQTQGELKAAVIYNPMLDELFCAEKGHGAFLNDHKIKVNQLRDLSQAVVTTGIPHLGRPKQGEFLRELAYIMPNVAGVRRTGAAALDLAYVAAGRFTGFWENNLQIWDMAAGILLIEEARGLVSDFNGSKDMFSQKNIIAGNEYIQPQLLNLITKAANYKKPQAKNNE